MIKTLDRWFVQRFQSERSGKFRVILRGYRDDGESIETSPLAAIDGALVTTWSGSQYRLGEPGVHVRGYTETAGLVYDPANPAAFLLTPEWAFEFKTEPHPGLKPGPRAVAR